MVGGSLRVLRLPYQLLAQGRWFSPGTPAFSTTKTGRYDIAEILLKVAFPFKLVTMILLKVASKHQKSNQSIIVSIGVAMI